MIRLATASSILTLAAAGVCLLALGCAPMNDRATLQHYPLEPPAPVSPSDSNQAEPGDLPSVRVAGVRGPAWLADAYIRYRLDYVEPARQARYARARWVAPPAQALASALRSYLAAGPWQAVLGPDADAEADWTLSLRLDELVHGFDSVDSGYASLRGTLLVVESASGRVLAQREVRYRVPADGADAAAGVAAMRTAVARLCAEAATLLTGLQ